MSSIRHAVIDVGTNSVKLLVADVAGQRVQPVWEDSKQTRLGRGFYETHQLQPEPIAKTAKAVAKFVLAAQNYQAHSIRIIATSAARDAMNPHDLVSAIEGAAGIKVEIISGDREAEWTFKGVATDPSLAQEPLLIVDLGGGSSEFILGRGSEKHFRESFPLGTVRLLERIPHGDPPKPEELAACREWLNDFLTRKVQPRLSPAIALELERQTANSFVQLIGTGGTTSIMARIEAGLEDYDRDRIEAIRLSLDAVRRQVERLWRLSLAERQQIIGLPPKRADVILTGALIFEAVMEQFGFSELRVSTRGLRFAAVIDPVCP
jgi:exopolyphosphatase/guanosine-5'-triphosphate,3'-diphosphate pyrophosphatase